jgi:tetratricopeptide (TPR) repeat protein
LAHCWLTSIPALLLLILAGCANQPGSGKESFEQDTAAVGNLRRIQSGVRTEQPPTQADVNLLEDLHKKYPAAAEVTQTLRLALQVSGNWEAVARLLEEKPESERSRTDQLYLAEVYFKLGRYQEVRKIVDPIVESGPTDVDLNSLAGQASYNQGQYEHAALLFDRVWDGIVARKKFDAMTMRGMIHFYLGDKARAVAVLRQTTELNPDYYPAYNALSRITFANGDRATAEAYLEKVKAIQARLTADKANKFRYVSRAHDLESAWQNHRCEEAAEAARLRRELGRTRP